MDGGHKPTRREIGMRNWPIRLVHSTLGTLHLRLLVIVLAAGMMGLLASTASAAQRAVCDLFSPKEASQALKGPATVDRAQLVPETRSGGSCLWSTADRRSLKLHVTRAETVHAATLTYAAEVKKVGPGMSGPESVKVGADEATYRAALESGAGGTLIGRYGATVFTISGHVNRMTLLDLTSLLLERF